MIIARAPFRVSLFGGSSDYKDFYEQHGSFLVGFTINKYFYSLFRYRPDFLSDVSVLSYSKQETVRHIDDIQHPLIRAIFKHYNIHEGVDLSVFADIPSRTGLGGSSAFCASLLAIIKKIQGFDLSKRELAEEAIAMERVILAESGGIQDQIWSSYGGFNSIDIDQHGKFSVKPCPISEDFKQYFKHSMLAVYTNENMRCDKVPKSHENKDKMTILQLAHEGYDFLIKEDIKGVGETLLKTWEEKKKISPLISSSKIDEVSNFMLNNGLYGVKLLGSGGSGFLLGIGPPGAVSKCKGYFSRYILPFDFDNEGASYIYQSS